MYGFIEPKTVVADFVSIQYKGRPNHFWEGRRRKSNTITALGRNTTGPAGHQHSEPSPRTSLSTVTFALGRTKGLRIPFLPEPSWPDPLTDRLRTPNPTPCGYGLCACGWPHISDFTVSFSFKEARRSSTTRQFHNQIFMTAHILESLRHKYGPFSHHPSASCPIFVHPPPAGPLYSWSRSVRLNSVPSDNHAPASVVYCDLCHVLRPVGTVRNWTVLHLRGLLIGVPWSLSSSPTFMCAYPPHPHDISGIL